MNQKTRRSYEVERGGSVTATVNGHALPHRLALVNHSPTGFEYGYEGSGPAQLALAILADYYRHATATELACARAAARGEATSPDQLAVEFHQAFKRSVVAQVPKATERWGLTHAEVSAALAGIYASRLTVPRPPAVRSA